MNRNRLARMAAAVSILLILGTALISSGICIEQTESVEEATKFDWQEEKTLTEKDIGTLLLSAIFTRDHEVRSFLFKVIHQLQQNGELSESDIQDIAGISFDICPDIYLFRILDVGYWASVIPILSFPWLISSITTGKTITSPYLLVYMYDGCTIGDEEIWGSVLTIGFVGSITNEWNIRFSEFFSDLRGLGILTLVWEYEIDSAN